MISWSNVLSWRASELDAVGQDLKSNRANVLNAGINLRGAAESIASTGDTARKMQSWFLHRSTEISKIEASLNYAIEATSTAQEGVERCHRDAENCEDTAAAQELVIDGIAGDVSVSPARQARIDALRDTNPPAYVIESLRAAIERQALEMRTHAVLNDARSVDDAYQTSLSAVEEGDIEPSAVSSGPIHSGMTPKEAAAAWNELSPEEQQALINSDPELIGNLDGVDAKSRDKANRLSLDRRIAAAYERIGGTDAYETYLLMQEYEKNGDFYNADLCRRRVEELLPPGFNSSEEFYEAINVYDNVHNLTSFRDELNSRSDTYLLKYSLDADGLAVDRAIVATGDVDNAKYINTFVPGMNTDVNENFFGYVDANENLRNVASAENGIPKHQIANITFLDYEPPTIPELARDAGDPTARMREGAGNLANFLEGIDASRAYNAETPEPHMTLMGHSYGSTTAAEAAKQVAPDVVDDLVMFGSPGAATDDINDYNLDSGRAHVSAVPSHDVIQGIGGVAATIADHAPAQALGTAFFGPIIGPAVGSTAAALVPLDLSDYGEEFGVDPKHLNGINHLSGDASLTVHGGTQNPVVHPPGLLERINPDLAPLDRYISTREHSAYLPNPNDSNKFTWDNPGEGKPNDPKGMVTSPIVSDLAKVTVNRDQEDE